MNIATITKDEISVYLDDAIGQLVNAINTFNDENFNKQPFEDSWTGGQVSEHLYKSVSRIPGLLLTETKDAARDPLEKCEAIGSIFLNFEVKLKSPDFILPTNEPKKVDFFVSGFKKTAEEIRAMTRQKDLSQLYTRFPFPTIGELTGWEWVFFAAAHAVRHTRQLKNIRKSI
jgi:uncharacterized damage-inducible protein DinB